MRSTVDWIMSEGTDLLDQFPFGYPCVCRRCGMQVAGNFRENHDLWHKELEGKLV